MLLQVTKLAFCRCHIYDNFRQCQPLTFVYYNSPKQVLMETDFLLLEMMLFLYRKCCLCSVYWYSILVYSMINTCVHCFLSNMFTIKRY